MVNSTMNAFEHLQALENADDDETIDETLNRVFDDPDGASAILDLISVLLEMKEDENKDLRKEIEREIRNHEHKEDGTTVRDY